MCDSNRTAHAQRAFMNDTFIMRVEIIIKIFLMLLWIRWQERPFFQWINEQIKLAVATIAVHSHCHVAYQLRWLWNCQSYREREITMIVAINFLFEDIIMYILHTNKPHQKHQFPRSNQRRCSECPPQSENTSRLFVLNSCAYAHAHPMVNINFRCPILSITFSRKKIQKANKKYSKWKKKRELFSSKSFLYFVEVA